MIPRECDNDDCDYEPYEVSPGQTAARWVHAPTCDGPVELPSMERLLANIPEGSFLANLAYNLGRK